MIDIVLFSSRMFEVKSVNFLKGYMKLILKNHDSLYILMLQIYMGILCLKRSLQVFLETDINNFDKDGILGGSDNGFVPEVDIKYTETFQEAHSD